MPDSNTVAIGATTNGGNGSNAGHVRIYKWDGAAWIQKGLDIDGEAMSDESGHSVSMADSNTVAIGAPGNDGTASNAGHVRIYHLCPQIATLKLPLVAPILGMELPIHRRIIPLPIP